MIELVKPGKDRASTYTVYIPMRTQDLAARMQVYVGDVPGFDDNDNEAFPISVIEFGFECGYLGESFQYAVDLAFRQKPTASSSARTIRLATRTI